MKYEETEFFWDATGGKAVISVGYEKTENGVGIFRFKADFEEKLLPEKIKIWWFTEYGDCFSTWTANGGLGHELLPSWQPKQLHSRTAFGAPVFSVMNKNGDNRCTFAVADAFSPIMLTAGLEERSGRLKCTADFFINSCDFSNTYETKIFVDERDIPYYESIYAVRSWWNSLGFTPMHTPPAAKRSMFSTWYCMQKNITEATVINHCVAAKKYGLDTVIVDDGWQCNETVNGYKYCGDWLPVTSKFTDMRKFTDALHAIGMKCMLWFSVPFMGINTENYKRFKDKMLRIRNNEVFILDPRYKEVRDYLIGVYTKAVREWNFDGLKLDFIDNFSFSDETPTDFSGMDIASLEKAIDTLLKDTAETLAEIKSDILIEYRQPYIGPAVQKYGNILRVGDCAGAALYNRVHSINLRLLAGDSSRENTTAIHSDMLMWDYTASPEAAADQLSACLFCTVQISVFPENLSPAHQKMLKTYLSFIKKYENVLVYGKLIPTAPESNFSLVTAENKDTSITAPYSEKIVTSDEDKNTVIAVNATGSDEIFAEIKNAPVTRKCKILNCMGEALKEETLTLSAVTKFTVPHNGFLYIEK